MLELSTILVALGYEDVNERNASEITRYLTIEMLQALARGKVDFGHGESTRPSRGTIIGWSEWWIKACQNELENRIETLLLDPRK